MQRRLFKYTVASLLFLLIAGIISFTYILPLYVENTIFPSLGRKLSTEFTGRLLAIGMHETAFDKLSLGRGEDRPLHMGSVRVFYSFPSLLEQKVDLVEIDGLTVNLEMTEDGLRFPGLDLKQIAGAETQKNITRSNQPVSLPVQLGELQISNGLINFLYKGNHILIPFSLQITGEKETAGKGFPVYDLHMLLSPQGEKIRLSATVDFSGNRGSCTFSAPELDLQKFVFLPDEQQGKFHFGKAAVTGSGTFSIMPFQVDQTDIEADLTRVNLTTSPVMFAPLTSGDGTATPLRLKITGDGNQYHVTARTPLREPLPAVIEVEASVGIDKETVRGSGRITGRVVDDTYEFLLGHQPIIVSSFPNLLGNFTFERQPSGTWQAAIESASDKKLLQVNYGMNHITAEFASYLIEGKGSSDTAEILGAFSLRDFRAEGPDNREIHVPAAELNASLDFSTKPDQGSMVSGDLSLKAPAVTMREGNLTGDAAVSLSGEIPSQKLSGAAFLHAGGDLTVKNGAFRDTGLEVNITAIEGRIPWQWPRSNVEYSGMLAIGGVSWEKNGLGSLNAGIRLKDSAYTWDGSFKHSLPDGLVTGINGRAGMTDSGYQATMKLSMADTAFSSLQLGKFSPALADGYIIGKLGLTGDLTIDEKGLRGKMVLGLHNGRLEFTKKKYVIDNLDFSLLIPSLPDLRSAPAQIILFDRASIGDFVLENGRVVWQLESPESIFIEEGAVRWAGGRVFTNSVRLSPERKEFIAPIFCDRLILTDILSQAGIKNAEGEGTVSGRIPLHISKKSIRIEDGFLYSSPGQGGSIRVSALDTLSAGIPKNTPQFAQVDFAAEALKNFQYNWVRLLLNSEGEDLVMKMNIDGKPMQTLPFRYDSRTGILQRDEGGGPGINQPIRLDVNFRLPLDRLLGYSGKIQDIWNKIK